MPPFCHEMHVGVGAHNIPEGRNDDLYQSRGCEKHSTVYAGVARSTPLYMPGLQEALHSICRSCKKHSTVYDGVARSTPLHMPGLQKALHCICRGCKKHSTLYAGVARSISLYRRGLHLTKYRTSSVKLR